MVDEIALIQAIAVTSEILGTQLSEGAARVMVQDLSSYPTEAVLASLDKCRRELTGRLTLAAIIQRIDDGHLGPEEAWALCPRSEDDTVVWTDEIADAYAVAAPLLAEGDKVAARMAFLESYRSKLMEARNAGRVARFWPSLGHDNSGREKALTEAARAGRLGAGHVMRLLNPRSEAAKQVRALLPPDEIKALPAPEPSSGEIIPANELAKLSRELVERMKAKVAE